MDIIERILLLPMCGLGDAVCYLPFLREMRSRNPEARITAVVVSEVAKTILESAGCSIEIIVFNRSGEQAGWKALANLLRRIRRGRFQVAFSGAHPNSVRVPLFAAISGAKLRVGASMERYSFLYNRKVNVRTDAHAHERFRRLLTAVGIEVAEGGYRPHFTVSPDAMAGALSLWKNAGLKEGDKVVGFASGADSNARGPWKPYLKRWRAERYGEIANWLRSEAGVRVVMFGGPEESVLAEQISSASNTPIVSFCGETGVHELAWLVSKCKAIVSNDTGVMHVSAAVGTPVIALFGPTSPDSFGPIGEKHRIVQGTIHCSPCYPFPTCDLSGCGAMDEISADRVIACLSDVLNPKNAGRTDSIANNELVQIRGK